MSLSFLATTNPTITTTNIPNFHPSSSKTPPSSITPTTVIRKSFAYTLCKKHEQDGNVGDDEGSNLDRRNVLFGLGGLYGATSTFGRNIAIGAPMQPPDLSQCQLATDTSLVDKVQCCPPYHKDSMPPMTDFKLPDSSEPLRTRPPAHKLDSKYLAKFRDAIAKMKALPKDDPWNFFQQAQIHCAYCNGSYNQVDTNPPVAYQVHGSWHFFTWHRYYLYFWERILGKLIDDPTFAIPYWSWDVPEGMRIPGMYLEPSSVENPLYDGIRNPGHFSALMDYKYKNGDPNPTPEEEPGIILANQMTLNKIFTENSTNPEGFMGQRIKAGESINGPGTLETLHMVPHMWCGQVEKPYWDMGNFHTTARDTLFWGHHANVDRLWCIYSNLRGNKVEFNTPDWLDATYVFYDENRQLVKCKVHDCLDATKLRYTYQQEELPWLHIRQTYYQQKKATPKKAEDEKLIAVTEFGHTPRLLDTTIRALVKRPKASRSKHEKEKEPEVIIIEHFKFDHSEPARFDVYIAKAVDGSTSSDLGESAGSFVHIPHSHGLLHMKHVLHLGITNLVEDIEADSSEELVVSLVPRLGEVTIHGIGIELKKNRF